MYKVYEITAGAHYNGMALVAAESAEEANQYIADFQKRDIHNLSNFWGYQKVDENDVINGLRAEWKGIIKYGIYYMG